MKYANIVLNLPDWIEGFLEQQEPNIPNVEDRMRLAIELSRSNAERGTGGPFGAGIFEQKTGKLVAVGVNIVEPSNCSIAHAEIIAIMMAQQQLGHYVLGSSLNTTHELVTSTEPCAMCLGAIGWSGIERIVCGARGQDAEKIGFDEGIKPLNWVTSFKDKGIEVVQEVLRDEAQKVLLQYKKSGGLIYNAHQAKT